MRKDKSKKKFLIARRGVKRNFSISEDPFFDSASDRKHKKLDEEIESDQSEDELGLSSADEGREEEQAEEEETAAETAEEKRLRIAKEYLDKIRSITRKEEEEREEDGDGIGDEGGDEATGEEKWDSLIEQKLRNEQLEARGRLRRLIASKIREPEAGDEFRFVQKHKKSVTAVCLSEDDSWGFSASKDGTILHWDTDSGKSEKYVWPSQEILISHGAKKPRNSEIKWSNHTLALSVSSDGRYLATGGLDRHVHLWDIRTREHIWAFPGHRGPISCLTFREGTSEIVSGSFDRSLKLWNAEDRAFIEPLFGHQAEVLTLDCLYKERVLSVGRDRTMHLWKIAETKQLVFLAPAVNLECCCFISNEEFLSGSDDGSVQLWSIMRKKPVCIIKNAHSLGSCRAELEEDDMKIDGSTVRENGTSPAASSTAQSWVSAVTACKGSDLAATGAANGTVRLWVIESSTRNLRPSYELSISGFVNALTFAKSGRFLLAGVGQEPRLGRWGRVSAARSGVYMHLLKLSE